jgi:hypothetical protein
MVPTARGPTAPGLGKEKRAPLPQASAKALKRATPTTSHSLQVIATSSTYGAPSTGEKSSTGASDKKPVQPDRARSQAVRRTPDIAPPTVSLDVTLRSAAGAVAVTTDGRLVGLLLTVILTTLAAIALAIKRARG